MYRVEKKTQNLLEIGCTTRVHIQNEFVVVVVVAAFLFFFSSLLQSFLKIYKLSYLFVVSREDHFFLHSCDRFFLSCLFAVSPEDQFFLHSCDRFLLVQGKCFFEVLFDL
jgi:hypothetical protein